MLLRIILLSLLISFPPIALSGNYERSAQKWQVKCSLAKTRFNIVSKSESGKPNEYDHLLYVSLSKNPLNIGKALNARSQVNSDVKPICDDLPVFDVGNDNILILLRQDDRPTFDLLTLVLYNLKSKQAVSRLENIGRVKAGPGEHFTMRKSEEGFDIKLIKQWKKNEGKNASEIPIEGWLRVSVGKKRISREWLE